MTMIKCDECGKDISDKAASCIGCGAPIISASKIEFVSTPSNGSFGDFNAIFGTLRDKTSTAIGDASKLGKRVFKSQAEKDAEAVAEL